jgi:hypothetical protein
MSKKSLLIGAVVGAALALGGVEGKRRLDLRPKFKEGTCIQGKNGSAPPAEVRKYSAEKQAYLLAVVVAPGLAVPMVVSKAELESMEIERINCDTGEVLE